MTLINNMKEWKIKNLDSKSSSFCGAKWYNASMWLFTGMTTSCHHNPPHQIDLEEIKTNPKALHNTTVKKNEREMMQRGEKPINCQFCWVMEQTDPDGLADRTWLSTPSSEKELEDAFTQSTQFDYDLNYLELSFDRTCNLACSYCCPAISSSWARDIRQNGPYTGLATDSRNHYVGTADENIQHKPNELNPYADAFFKWWEDSLHSSLRTLRLTGGEPMMSGETWKLFDWLKNNRHKTNVAIHITTNLSYNDEIMSRFLDTIQDAGITVEIYTSGETLNEKAEYIRDGLEWAQWIKNIERALACESVTRVSICGTISAGAAEGFPDFLRWLAKQKLLHGKRTSTHTGIKELELSVNPVRFPTFQNIVVLPETLRNELAQEIKTILAENDCFSLFEQDHISRFATYLTDVAAPHRTDKMQHDSSEFKDSVDSIDIPALQQDFKRFFTQYDQRRGQDFVKTFPRLKEWYNSIQ